MSDEHPRAAEANVKCHGVRITQHKGEGGWVVVRTAPVSQTRKRMEGISAPRVRGQLGAR